MTTPPKDAPKRPECPVCGLPEVVLGEDGEAEPHPDCEAVQQVEAYLPVEAHYYVSTPCIHEAHGACRGWCRFCREPCLCPCHSGVELEVELPWPLG